MLHIKSRFRKPSDLSNIPIGDSTVESTSCARNFGVQFEDNLSMEKHVNNVCRAASFALHKLGQIRKYLDKNTTEKLVHAFVTCRLDNCNSLFYGLPDKLIAKLQRTQNSAARLVTLTKSRDHISPILRDLHWLPVKSRTMYKILVLTYKCIHGCAPLYPQELIQMYKPTRNLRSSSKQLLVQSLSSTKTYDLRAFQHSCAELWNKLPNHIKNAKTLVQFKTSLKTYLFIVSD